MQNVMIKKESTTERNNCLCCLPSNNKNITKFNYSKNQMKNFKRGSKCSTFTKENIYCIKLINKFLNP